MSGPVRLAARDAPAVLEADVVVCGAGSAGLGAALAAARAGATVALIERWPFFGGNATAASLGSICGLYVRSGDGFEHLSSGIAREWTDALASSGNGLGPIPYKDTAVMTYVPWGYKRVADRLVGAEPRITPLLHSFVSAVVRSGDAIEAVVISTKKGPVAVRGRVFVDATGDADLVFHGGWAWEMGGTGRLQYPSMQFFVQGGDLDAAMSAGLGHLADKMRDAIEAGTYPLTRTAGAVIPTMRPGEFVGAMNRVALEDGSPPDGTDIFDLTHAELAGRRIAEESSAFLRAEMPGFGSAFLQDTATTVGIRETRHALGEHVISFAEASACTKHADAVAASAWPFEFHTRGADTTWEFLPDGDWFEIPYGSLVVKDADNLLAAGRCISAEHEALASLRVTGVCMAIGEAAGAAAARLASDGIAARDLDGEALHADLASRAVVPVR